MNHLEEPANPQAIATELEELGLYELAALVLVGLVDAYSVTLF